MQKIVTNFDFYIKKIFRELTKLDKKKYVFSDLNRKLIGLENVLASYETIAPIINQDGLHIEEWNPFAQRVLVDQKPFLVKPLIQDFQLIAKNLNDFLQLVHEAFHILLLENFFTGHQKIKSEKQFIHWSLANEAFCFWYSDIKMTPLVRLRLPDAELIYSKSAASSYYFHPYRALLAAGVKSDKDSLLLYLSSFTGFQSKLHKKNNIYAENLRLRIYKFYQMSEVPLGLLYQSLKKIGVFDEYYDRFCSINNLPKLIPNTLLSKNSDLSFYQKLLTDGLSHIQKEKKIKLESVKIRRCLQTRAYYVFCIENLLKNDKCFSLKNKTGHSDRVLGLIQNYLLNIEKNLFELAKSDLTLTDLKHVKISIKKNDEFYHKKIRSFFKRNSIFVSDRGFFLKWYTQNIGAINFGIIEKRQVKKSEIRALITMILKEIEQDSKFLKKYQDILISLQKIDRMSSSNKTVAYNQILKSPKILKMWSVRLDEIDPINNKFRELFFQYQ